MKENHEMTWGKGGKERGKDNPGGGNQGGGNQGGKPNDGKGKWNKNKEKNKGKGKDDKEDKDKTVSAVGVQGDNSEKYCFKCGDSQHFARECKKTGPFSCSVHPNATSHDRQAWYTWWKAYNMPVASSRPPSRERKKETPSGAQNGNTNTGSSGSQNLVSTDGIDPIDERNLL